MVWFKVDDGFHSSRKVLSIPRRQRLAAVGLWTMAGNWSARELTDGKVPSYVLDELGATETLIRALVEARLWLDQGSVEARPKLDRGSTGIEFTNWAEYQPTRAEVEADRAKAAERQRKWRERHKGETQDEHVSNGVTDGVTNGVSHAAPTRPDPTRPSISNEIEKGVPRKRATRIPDPFIVTTDMREWATGRTPLVVVDDTTERFVNYWRAKAGKDATKLDWLATWQNWLLRDQDDRTNRKLTPTERAAQTVAAGRRVAGQQITSLTPKEIAS